MDLKRKLSFLNGARPPAAAPSIPNPLAAARTPVAQVRREAEAPPASAARPSTAAGSNRVEKLFAVDHRHGHTPLAPAIAAAPGVIAALALDPSLAEIDPGRALFLDTETTGLAGGTGTLPFVVGMASFDGGQLRLVQRVLHRPGEEREILEELASRMASASVLVTYNGKSFDWPLLRTRFVMNRLRAPEALPHLDLLHCARRVYRYRQNGARLIQLEADVIGHRRIGDVPGEQIPELYFRFLRNGDRSLLDPVVEHNEHDLVLLAALLGRMAQEYSERRTDDPRDRLGYAWVCARNEDFDGAEQFARGAAETADRTVGSEALSLLGALARRRGDVLGAVDALGRAASLASGFAAARMHLELAKLYEHRVRDLHRARDHATNSARAERPELHRRRLQRIDAKLMRRSAASGLFG